MKRAKVVFAVLLGMVVAVLPSTAEATAEQTGPSATGTVGAVQMTVNGVSTQAGPLASCETGQTAGNSSAAVTIGGTGKYGAGSTQGGPPAGGSRQAPGTGSRVDTKV